MSGRRGSTTSHRRRRGATVLLALLLGACGRDPVPASPVADATAPLLRTGRLGSLRDLVLFERPEVGPVGALFIDRFEATRGDWAAFAASPAGREVDAGAVLHGGDPALPIAAISASQARRFAQWRFLRLPRSDELRFVTAGDRSNPFPWGRRPDPMRANTFELGLWRATPVGTFESGRRAIGDAPYDLIGNVSEWTESIPAAWWEERRPQGDEARPWTVLDPIAGVRACRTAVAATPALAVWQGPAGLVPAAWLVAAGGEHVPREVVGGDFLAKMEQPYLLEVVLAGDRRERTGVRLGATAGELLRDLGRDAMELTPADELQVRRFVRRAHHRDVLLAAVRELAAVAPPLAHATPLARVLRQELGLPDESGR